MTTRRSGGAALTVVLAALVLVCALPLAAQEWSGSVGAAYTWQSVSGSEQSFRSQSNLQEGFTLEDLTLTNKDAHGKNRFTLQAWGFGTADPSQHAKLGLDLGAGWSVALRYDRRESFFGLAGGDFSARGDDWQITRWNGKITWDGWSAVRLSLDLHRVERGGDVQRTFYGLGEQYPGRIALDETMDEATLRLETKTLPVHITLEQSVASYERRNRWSPDGGTNVDANDPDLLTDLGTTYRDKQDVPTTVATASYASATVAVSARVLWSSADLDTTGAGWQEFAIGGGPVGTVRFVDDVVGSASMDTLAGGLDLAVALGRGWRVNLRGAYRDASSDSALLGQRLIHVANPIGAALDLSAPIDNNGRFDYTNTSYEATLEYRGTGWSAWGGGLVGSREVTWRRTIDDPGEDVNRDSTGAVAGFSLRLANGVNGSLEYRHGTFEEYVFRTDPETVDRVTLRVRSQLGSGWSLTAHGRFERADNPTAVASLDHRSDGGGVGVAWAAKNGDASLGIDVSVLSLTTDTGIVLPDGGADLSRYDLSLTTLTAYGRATLGKVRLRGSVTRVEDSGNTWPVSSWNAALRAGLELAAHTELAAFIQHWSYNEDRSSLDDFKVTRYGVALSWSF